jgi:hypothetical protein
MLHVSTTPQRASVRRLFVTSKYMANPPNRRGLNEKVSPVRKLLIQMIWKPSIKSACHFGLQRLYLTASVAIPFYLTAPEPPHFLRLQNDHEVQVLDASNAQMAESDLDDTPNNLSESPVI